MQNTNELFQHCITRLEKIVTDSNTGLLREKFKTVSMCYCIYIIYYKRADTSGFFLRPEQFSNQFSETKYKLCGT